MASTSPKIALLTAFILMNFQAGRASDFKPEMEGQENQSPKQKVLIVGAGLSGLAAALGLKNAGIEVDIIEKRASFSTEGAGIALPANAVWALEKLGLKEAIAKKACLIKAMEFAKDTGERLSYQNIEDIHPARTPFRAIHRQDLQNILLQSIHPPSISFNTSINRFEENENGVRVDLSNGQHKFYELVIGADGIHSDTRNRLYHTSNQNSLTTHNLKVWRTVIGPIEGLDHPVYMLGLNTILLLYPLDKNQTYIYGQMVDFARDKSDKGSDFIRFQENFKKYKGLAPHALQQINSDHLLIPGILESVQEVKWGTDHILLLGDAAHGCSPSLQQGGALCLEDAYVLQDEFQKGLIQSLPLGKILDNFKHRRKERVNRIVSLSAAKIQFMSQAELELRYATIQEEGAPNIAAFKILMATNP